MAEHKEETLEFGELPVALRQAIGNFLWHRESVAHCGARVAVQPVSITVAYEVQVEDSPPRTERDVARDVNEGSGVHRTHEDFGPRLPRSHDPRDERGPGWDKVGC